MSKSSWFIPSIGADMASQAERKRLLPILEADPGEGQILLLPGVLDLLAQALPLCFTFETRRGEDVWPFVPCSHPAVGVARFGTHLSLSTCDDSSTLYAHVQFYVILKAVNHPPPKLLLCI